MKRVIKSFAAGARVYAAGGKVADTHPVVKGREHLFEDAPGPGPEKPKQRARRRKDTPGADGET